MKGTSEGGEEQNAEGCELGHGEKGEGERRKRNYYVSGPGLQSTTANHPTRVAVELSDSSVRPCSLKQDVTAELILYSTSSQATLTSGGRWADGCGSRNLPHPLLHYLLPINK